MNLKDRRKLKDRCPEYRKKTKPNGRYSREGFLSAMPFGCNRFGSQFERVLPASAIGNMFPFNFSGKTDPNVAEILAKWQTQIQNEYNK